MKVRNYFFAGLAGDAASLQKGMKICEDILANDPKQPEALVWHGTGLVSESREAFQKGDQQNGAASGSAAWTKWIKPRPWPPTILASASFAARCF
jgi:hypothetical protein